MKFFKVHFISRRDSLVSRDVYLNFQADTLEHLTPRIKRAVEQLNKLPNPTYHSSFSIDNISEVVK